MKTLHPAASRAYTLVEALLAMTIVGFVMAGVMTFYVTAQSTIFTSEQKLLINGDIRTFTETVMSNARDANWVVLYQAFYPYTTANNSFPYTGTTVGSNNDTNSTAVSYDLNASNTFTALDRVGIGGSGDYLVFISFTDPFYGFVPANPTIPFPTMTVTRLVLYWIAPNRIYPGENAMYTFDSNTTNGVLPWSGVNLSAGTTAINATTTLESLLPANTLAEATDPGAKIALNDVRGLGANGLCFLNYSNIANTSMLMQVRILHGNASKRVTDTYDFTITPRG
jgi:type II secretory pathway pseudopilin PulG